MGARRRSGPRQGGAQRARRGPMGDIAAVQVQHGAGDVRQLPAHLTPGALDPGDAHVVVARGLMSHPRDDGGLGAALQGDALGAGHGAAAYGGGVGGDEHCHALGVRQPRRGEGEEAQHGVGEVDLVGLLLAGAALASGGQLLLVGGGGALGVEGGAGVEDVRFRRPHVPGEEFVVYFFCYGLGGVCCFYVVGEFGVIGGK